MSLPLYPDAPIYERGRLPTFEDCIIEDLPMSPFVGNWFMSYDYSVYTDFYSCVSAPFLYENWVYQAFIGGFWCGTEAVGDIWSELGGSGIGYFPVVWNITSYVSFPRWEFLGVSLGHVPTYQGGFVDIEKRVQQQSQDVFQCPLYALPQEDWYATNNTFFPAVYYATAFYNIHVEVFLGRRPPSPKGVGTSVFSNISFLGRLLFDEGGGE